MNYHKKKRRIKKKALGRDEGLKKYIRTRRTEWS